MELLSKDFIGEASAILSEIVHRLSATELKIVNGKSTNSTMLIKCEELEQSNKLVRGCLMGIDLPPNCFFIISHILFLVACWMDGWVGGWFAHLLVCLLACLLAHLLICSSIDSSNYLGSFTQMTWNPTAAS